MVGGGGRRRVGPRVMLVVVEGDILVISVLGLVQVKHGLVPTIPPT